MPILDQFISSFFNFVAFPSNAYANYALERQKHSESRKGPPVTRQRTKSTSSVLSSRRNSAMSTTDEGESVKEKKRPTSMFSTSSDVSMGSSSEDSRKGVARTVTGQKENAKGVNKVKLKGSLSALSSATRMLKNASSTPSISTSSTTRPAKAETSSLLGAVTTRSRTKSTSALSIKPMQMLNNTSRNTSQPTTESSQLDAASKDLKRKRSSSSATSITNLHDSHIPQLSSRLYGHVLKSSKRVKVSTKRPSMEVTVETPEVEEVDTSREDVHSAIRKGGVRLVGPSVDFDDIYDEKPDDIILDPSSILAHLNGEHPLCKSDNNFAKVKMETAVYHLWVACKNACRMYPLQPGTRTSIDDDTEEVEEPDWERRKAQEKRVYHAFQYLFVNFAVATLDRLPAHGVVHIPMDPRISYSVVEMVQRTLSLVSLLKEVNLDMNRIIFDIPSTQAGLHAGRILSLTHQLLINFTLVCDLHQAAACMIAKPYGVSIPVKAIRATEEGETPIQQGPLVGLSHRDARDEPIPELARSIVKLVRMLGLKTIVSARDIEAKDILSALYTIQSVSPSPKLLEELRWYAAKRERSLYSPLNLVQGKRAEVKAKQVASAHQLLSLDTASSERRNNGEDLNEVLGSEIAKAMKRPPQIQRKYVDRSWILSSGLPRHVEIATSFSNPTASPLFADFDPYQDRLPPAHQNTNNSHSTANRKCQRSSYMDGQLFCLASGRRECGCTSAPKAVQPIIIPFGEKLSMYDKKRLMQIVEAALEDQCVRMGKLHETVKDYMDAHFS